MSNPVQGYPDGQRRSGGCGFILVLAFLIGFAMISSGLVQGGVPLP